MSVKDINIKKHRYYFYDDIINIKDFDPNDIKIDEQSYKNILICYIGYVALYWICGNQKRSKNL